MTPCVFDYMDFREYLADYFEAKKKATPSFSYSGFTVRAGLKSKSFIHHVIHGQKNLSKQSILGVSRALGHNAREAEYFENLVFFNQASNLKDRNYYFERITAVKTCMKEKVVLQELRKNQFDYFSNWYNSAIRSIIGLYSFKGDYQWLSKSVYPRITPKQAKKAVVLLEQLGLIIKGKDGRYKLVQKNITTGSEVQSLAVQNFHSRTAALAQSAIENLPKDKRNMTGLTLGISRKTYLRICEEAKAFRQRISEIASADEEADGVYQLNLHLFPMSDIRENGGAS